MRAGGHYDEFWRRTPAELTLITKAKADQFKDEQRARRAADYALGILISYAFNDPKKYPDAKEWLEERESKTPKTLAEQRRFLDMIAKRVH